MGLYQWEVVTTIWDPLFGLGSEKVLHSSLSAQMSDWLRMPDAHLGFIAYLGDLLFALAGSSMRWRDRPWLVILFGIDVIPLGAVSLLLVFLQATVIQHFCFLCLITALISLILIFLAYPEVAYCLRYLKEVKKQTKTRKEFWNVFWGKPSALSHRVATSMIGKIEEKKEEKILVLLWPRLLEVLLGIWWITSLYLFKEKMMGGSFRWLIGLAIFFFAIFSWNKRWTKLHLLNSALALSLILTTYIRFTPPPPLFVQIDLLAAWTLGMLSLLPSNS
jgi:hypothetical protein